MVGDLEGCGRGYIVFVIVRVSWGWGICRWE